VHVRDYLCEGCGTRVASPAVGGFRLLARSTCGPCSADAWRIQRFSIRWLLSDGAWHSIERLAQLTGLPLRGIERLLRELEPAAVPERAEDGSLASWGTGSPYTQRWRAQTRAYCGRVGMVVELVGGTCPECGLRHEALIDQSTCMHFAPCPHSQGHGHPCLLERGHAGEHETRGCGYEGDEQ
jgi:hypothetical protein